ncbi:DUF6531 domain-containing protein [Massilia endophytica]|uniref:DUF6531 domain-containing protein n=1 Tax=Massilia endophytica TaxID=2899220 RepID=UPI001E32EEEC|nr:DUF6531 domain-containing protein [Massilia endophytica]UGQ45400.1 DUF6531 domain-containing protein [Massilia endophytica]
MKSLVFILLLLLQLPSLCHAQIDDSPGWVYGFPPRAAATPEEACRLNFRMWPDEFLYLEPAPLSGIWNGAYYHCWYRLKFTGTKYRLSTFLRCGPEEHRAWPGVCTRRIWRQPKAENCSSNEPSHKVGNPVTVTSGAKVEDEIDFVWGPTDLHRIARSYRSIREAMPAAAGRKLWSFSFQRSLSVLPASSASAPSLVTITDNDGSVEQYKQTDGRYQATASDTILTPIGPGFDKWAHLQPQGLLDIYEKAGEDYRLASTHAAGGAGIVYTYDQENRLTRITDTFGRIVDIEWTPEENISAIGNAGGSVAYEYEAVGTENRLVGTYRLRSVSQQTSDKEELATTRYHYTDGDTWQSRFLLESIEHDPDVKFAQFSYDDEGRVLSSEHAGTAYRHTFSYPNRSSTVVTDPLGAVRIYSYKAINQRERITEISQPGGSGCASAAHKLTYDRDGGLSSLVKFDGLKICFANHATRNLEISRIQGLSAAESCPAASAQPAPGQRKISTRWHPVWRLKTGIAEPLRITSYVYNGQPDPDGKVFTCANGGKLPDGSPIAVICKRIEQPTTDQTGAQGFAATAHGAARVTSYAYNAMGQILSSTEVSGAGGGNTTGYEYYSDTAPSHTSGDLHKVTDAKGHTTEYLEYTPSGLATSIRTPQGTVTERSYDALQRMTRHVIAAGTPDAETTSFSYNPAGLLSRVDLPDLSYLQYSYDQAERLTAITDKAGNSVEYTLDGMGNRIREEIRDASGTLTRQITRVYDVLNRLQDSTEKTK